MRILSHPQTRFASCLEHVATDLRGFTCIHNLDKGDMLQLAQDPKLTKQTFANDPLSGPQTLLVYKNKAARPTVHHTRVFQSQRQFPTGNKEFPKTIIIWACPSLYWNGKPDTFVYDTFDSFEPQARRLFQDLLESGQPKGTSPLLGGCEMLPCCLTCF